MTIQLLRYKYWILFLLLFCNLNVNAQISNPRSVSVDNFQTVQIDPNSTDPKPRQQLNYQQSPNFPPMGMNGNVMMQQHQQSNLRNMGYNPPVIPSSDPMIRHQQMLQSTQLQSRQQQQIEEIRKISFENRPTVEQGQLQRFIKIAPYKAVFDELIKMYNNQVPFSLKKAVFMIENVYVDKTLNYAEFERGIKARVNEIKLIIQNEKISDNNNLGKNYAIQKLFSEKIVEHRDGKIVKTYHPFQYDFDDFFGEKDWSKMFVSKLLRTGKGQCHSLPLLYLILADEIKAKAWLSLSPQHSFIQFSDNKNTIFNFETTNGNPVSMGWLMESGYINTTAIQTGIYLDTLGRNGLMSTLLADLIIGYTIKFGYDDFTISMIDSLIEINPKTVQGHIFKADVLTLKTNKALKKVNNPPIEQIQNYPEAFDFHKQLLAQYKIIKNLGFAEMPKDMYSAWLSSLNNEKNKQEKQKLKSQLLGNVRKNN